MNQHINSGRFGLRPIPSLVLRCRGSFHQRRIAVGGRWRRAAADGRRRRRVIKETWRTVAVPRESGLGRLRLASHFTAVFSFCRHLYFTDTKLAYSASITQWKVSRPPARQMPWLPLALSAHKRAAWLLTRLACDSPALCSISTWAEIQHETDGNAEVSVIDNRSERRHSSLWCRLPGWNPTWRRHLENLQIAIARPQFHTSSPNLLPEQK